MLTQLFTNRQSCRNYSTKPVEREKLLQEYKDDLNESLTYTIAGVNVSYQSMYNDAATEKAKREIKAEWDKAISDLISGRDTQLTDMMLKSLSFDYNTVADTFGQDLDTTFKGFSQQLKTYAKKFKFFPLFKIILLPFCIDIWYYMLDIIYAHLIWEKYAAFCGTYIICSRLLRAEKVR